MGHVREEEGIPEQDPNGLPRVPRSLQPRQRPVTHGGVQPVVGGVDLEERDEADAIGNALLGQRLGDDADSGIPVAAARFASVRADDQASAVADVVGRKLDRSAVGVLDLRQRVLTAHQGDECENEGSPKAPEPPLRQGPEQWNLDRERHLSEAWEEMADVLRRDASEIVAIDLCRAR